MRNVVASIEGEYRRYKTLAEGAMSQMEDAELMASGPAGGNSVAVLVAHVAGNLKSRFTDFLTSDGEKPWRDRESEFVPAHMSRGELLAAWDGAWHVLFSAIAALADEDLVRTVTIRQQPLTIAEALQRSLAHAAYHVGQIVYLGKAVRGDRWRWLSIPPGGSAAYNRHPTRERAPGPKADDSSKSG